MMELNEGLPMESSWTLWDREVRARVMYHKATGNTDYDLISTQSRAYWRECAKKDLLDSSAEQAYTRNMSEREGETVSAEFKVGDVVRLTGENWGLHPTFARPGSEVTITGFSWGQPTFEQNGRTLTITNSAGYGAELVKPYRTLAEKRQDDFEVLERASRPWRDAPDYYKFPRDVQTTDISMHLNSNGGQAVGYISRSTRIDGLNKEDDPRDSLRKAIDLIQMEIYRLDEKFGTKSEESE